jgi:hypothetical protein
MERLGITSGAYAPMRQCANAWQDMSWKGLGIPSLEQYVYANASLRQCESLRLCVNSPIRPYAYATIRQNANSPIR